MSDLAKLRAAYEDDDTDENTENYIKALRQALEEAHAQIAGLERENYELSSSYSLTTMRERDAARAEVTALKERLEMSLQTVVEAELEGEVIELRTEVTRLEAERDWVLDGTYGAAQSFITAGQAIDRIKAARAETKLLEGDVDKAREVTLDVMRERDEFRSLLTEIAEMSPPVNERFDYQTAYDWRAGFRACQSLIRDRTRQYTNQERPIDA
jgi:predicted RNase H-like nuclease (RuvC/YqgF family)